MTKKRGGEVKGAEDDPLDKLMTLVTIRYHEAVKETVEKAVEKNRQAGVDCPDGAPDSKAITEKSE